MTKETERELSLVLQEVRHTICKLGAGHSGKAVVSSVDDDCVTIDLFYGDSHQEYRETATLPLSVLENKTLTIHEKVSRIL